MHLGKDENTNFNTAQNELKNIGILLKDKKINELEIKYKKIFDKIKEKISNNEDRAQEFIKNLKEYYNITKEEDIDELTILFKSKKYDLDINSIIFFFENFQTDSKECNDELSEKIKNIKIYLKKVSKKLK